jgi:hypothetical protein
MTEPRKGLNLELDLTSKRTEARWDWTSYDWTSNEIEPRKWSNKFNIINLMSVSKSSMKKIKNPPEISQNQPTIWTFYHYSVLCKGTVSRDWDVLLVVWLDRALLGDEPLTGFKLFLASWFLTLYFTIRGSPPTKALSSYATCISSQSHETVPLNTVIL